MSLSGEQVTAGGIAVSGLIGAVTSEFGPVLSFASSVAQDWLGRHSGQAGESGYSQPNVANSSTRSTSTAQSNC